MTTRQALVSVRASIDKMFKDYYEAGNEQATLDALALTGCIAQLANNPQCKEPLHYLAAGVYKAMLESKGYSMEATQAYHYAMLYAQYAGKEVPAL